MHQPLLVFASDDLFHCFVAEAVVGLGVGAFALPLGEGQHPVAGFDVADGLKRGLARLRIGCVGPIRHDMHGGVGGEAVHQPSGNPGGNAKKLAKLAARVGQRQHVPQAVLCTILGVAGPVDLLAVEGIVARRADGVADQEAAGVV